MDETTTLLTCPSQASIPLQQRVAELEQAVADPQPAAEALREYHDCYAASYDNCSFGVYLMTPDGRVVMANPALVRILGYETIDDLLAEDFGNQGYDSAYVHATLVAHDGQIDGMEYAWRRKDGCIISLRESSRVLCDDQGRPLYYQGIVEDISAHRQAAGTDIASAASPAQPITWADPQPEPPQPEATQQYNRILARWLTTEGARDTIYDHILQSNLATTNSTGDHRAAEGSRHQTGAERILGGISYHVVPAMEFLGYWKIIRKRLWLIIMLMFAAGVSAAYYSEQQPILYRTTTTLFLNPAATSPLIPYESSSTVNRVQSLANTYSEFMRTRSFAHLVIQELGIPMSENEVQEKLSTAYVADTQFFRIIAIHSDPASAQALANTAAQVLIAENTTRRRIEQQQIEAQQNPDLQRLADLRVTLQDELTLYNDRIKNLQGQITDLQHNPQSEQLNKQIVALQEQLVQFQELRSSTLTALTETQTALANSAAQTTSHADTAVVVDEASFPATPLPRKTVMLTLLALVASLAMGAGLAVLLEYLNYTIKNPEVLEIVYGLPVMGVIGVSHRKQGQGKQGPGLVTLSDPHSPEAEAFRTLRTGIIVTGFQHPMRSLLVTSAQSGEGKSFIAANLAVSFAQNGSRVILVDADLRKPSLHWMFDLPLNPGFTNLVIDQQEKLANVLQPTAVQNLWVLTCGIVPPNPAELLGSPRAAQVMVQLEDNADIVIYDSAPAATVTDAAVLASQMDGVFQVVLAGGTRIDLVRRCKTILERVDTHVIGPVLNQVKPPDMESAAYNYGYYHEHPRPAGLLAWRRLFTHRGPAQNKAIASAADANQYSPEHGQDAAFRVDGAGSHNGHSPFLDSKDVVAGPRRKVG